MSAIFTELARRLRRIDLLLLRAVRRQRARPAMRAKGQFWGSVITDDESMWASCEICLCLDAHVNQICMICSLTCKIKKTCHPETFRNPAHVLEGKYGIHKVLISYPLVCLPFGGVCLFCLEVTDEHSITNGSKVWDGGWEDIRKTSCW